MNSEKDLIDRWKFERDASGSCGESAQALSKSVIFGERGPVPDMPAARFDGESSVIKITGHPVLSRGKKDFTISCWIHTGESSEGGDVIGDIISCFDPAERCGFNLSVVTNGGVTHTTQANYRHLHFGIDQGRSHGIEDCGRPGESVFVNALASVEGELYAGTLENAPDRTGHLYRYAGNKEWEDMGTPPDCSNCVGGIARFEGKFYVSSARYQTTGSLLGQPKNINPGGHVYLVDDNGQWTDCGHPGIESAVSEDANPSIGNGNGKADAAVSLTVYRGRLYCASANQRGVFVYEGKNKWRNIGPESRVFSLIIYRDRLYMLANGGVRPEHGGALYRYEKDGEWEFCGRPGKSTQTYGAVIYAGNLYAGTWPDGEVHLYKGKTEWENLGWLGYAREVMAMVLYNGKFYAGTLPMANIWRYDGEKRFAFAGNADNSEVVLRRAWSMAVHRGSLYIGTLPSGHVKRYRAGVMATSDSSLPAGWHHIAATRGDSRLKIYLDGRCVAESEPFNSDDYDLSTGAPLKIGFGQHEHFRGLMADLRIYGRCLTPEDVNVIISEAKTA